MLEWRVAERRYSISKISSSSREEIPHVQGYVRSMNQGKLEVIKQEMTRVNVDILGISDLKWTGMGEFNSDDHYIYYCGQECLRRNGVAIIVNKKVQNAVLGCNLKMDRMISVHFEGKPSNITVIQVYAPTSNAEEAEVEWFYEDLQDLLELTAKRDVFFIPYWGFLFHMLYSLLCSF